MSARNRELLIYAAKCITGTLLVFGIARIINYSDIGWCLISVMLVLSPDGKEAVSLAVIRIKANIVGAATGVFCLLLSHSNMWIVALALALTVSFCYLFKLENGVRSALAATIIIMLHDSGKHLWDAALERIIAVLAGCILALIVTFIFHFRIKTGEKQFNNQQEG